MSDGYLDPLTRRLPAGIPIALLESGWPAECGLLKGCPWEAGPVHQLTYARAAQKLAAKTAADGHPIKVSALDVVLEARQTFSFPSHYWPYCVSQIYNWLFLNAENVTLPNTASAQGDFATISLRTAEGKPRVGLREIWTTGWNEG